MKLSVSIGGVVVTVVDVEAGNRGLITPTYSTVSAHLGSAILGAAAAEGFNLLDGWFR